MRDGAAGRGLAIGQGAFYVAAGVWPLLDEPSFEAITGPKREPWLVKTVGVLVAAIGATLAAAGARRTITAEVAALGAVTAAGIAIVEGWYAGPRRRISPIYLADAALEGALAAAWGVALARRGGAAGPRRGRGRGEAS